LQKDTKHYYKAKIISKITNHGIFAPWYVGNWSIVRDAVIELHKFWVYHDDHNRCDGGPKRKYVIGRSILPFIWHVQEGNNLTEDEVTTLKEPNFLLFEKLMCNPRNVFGDDAFILVNKLADANAWLKT
jgi:hypothetical protein